jgi:hypothetical protein
VFGGPGFAVVLLEAVAGLCNDEPYPPGKEEGMAKTICIMFTSYEAPLTAAPAAFRLGALSAEIRNGSRSLLQDFYRALQFANPSLTGLSLSRYSGGVVTRFWGGFDIYASVLLTPSCFLFQE